MEFDEKLSLISSLSLEKRFYAPENIPLVREIKAKFPETIYASLELYKYNKFGFKKKRTIYLTSSTLINTDSKTIHNTLPYSEMKAMVEHPESLQLVLIDDKNKSYLLYFWSHYNEFCHILQILAKAKNKNVKIYIFNDLKTKIQDIFYAKSAVSSLNSVISQQGAKSKSFPKEIKFFINFDTFISDNIKDAKILYRQENWNIAFENCQIKKVMKRDENWTVLQFHNNSTNEEYIVKVAKKWNLTNAVTNSQISYLSLFESYSHVEGLAEILLIAETKCFVFIMQPYYPFGNLYNFIYPSNDKNVLSEITLKSLVKQILEILKRVHSKNKVLLSIFPEDIYLKNQTTIVISHITSNKINVVNKLSEKLVMNCEYTPPEVISNKTINVGLDFWCLGILMYECLFGVTPFQQNSEKDTENMILYSDVFFPPDDYKKISNETKQIILTLLVKNAEIRDGYKADQFLESEWIKDTVKNKELIDETYQKVFETMVRDRKINTLSDGYYDVMKME